MAERGVWGTMTCGICGAWGVVVGGICRSVGWCACLVPRGRDLTLTWATETIDWTRE